MAVSLGEDCRRMSNEIFSFVGDLDRTLDEECDLGHMDYDHILVCGMGGSAIGGDIMQQSIGNISKIPMKVNRFPSLPSWADEDTLVVASSYSGNTKETLLMYECARDRGCKLVSMTTGGRLLEQSESDGTPVVRMEAGVQPRSALGKSLGHLAGILDSTGGIGCRQEFRNALPSLYRLRGRLSEGEMAWDIARAIGRKVPVIYSTNTLYSTAIRWKTQINENSKTMAFSGSVPDFNHNEVAGWAKGDIRDMFYPIFLFEENAHREVRKAMRASIDTVKSYGVDPMVVKVKGKTITERLLSSVMIGDYVSLYLAVINGVDPVSVASINEFKSDLSRRLSEQRRDGSP